MRLDRLLIRGYDTATRNGVNAIILVNVDAIDRSKKVTFFLFYYGRLQLE
jgi:hypothetical protein